MLQTLHQLVLNHTLGATPEPLMLSVQKVIIVSQGPGQLLLSLPHTSQVTVPSTVPLPAF